MTEKYSIFSTHTCSFCRAAQSLLNQRGLEFDMKYIDTDPQLMEEYKNLFPAAKTVPMILKDHGDGFVEKIGGYEDLANSLIKG